MKPFQSIGGGRGEKGSLTLVLPLIALVSFTIMGLASYLAGFDTTLANSGTKLELHKLNAAVMARAERALKNPGGPCDRFANFRNLEQSTPAGIEISSPAAAVPCFLTKDEAESLSYFSLSFERIPGKSDLVTFSTHVKIAVESSKDSVLGPILGVKGKRNYILRVARAVDFALILKGSQTTPINIKQSGRLIVEGNTLHTGPSPLDLSSWLGKEGDRFPIEFRGYVHSRASHFQFKNRPQDFSRERLAKVARFGLQSGTFGGVTLPFEENLSSWNQPIDWGYMYGPLYGGYPLPRLSGALSTLGGSFDFSPSRAALNDLPHPDTLQQLSQSCEVQTKQTGFLRSFIRLQSESDLTLRFDEDSGSVFCGLVAAKTLRLIVDNGSKPVVLLGTFIVSDLVIHGNSPVYILRPGQSLELPPEVSLPVGQSLMGLAAEQSTLGTSIAHNFYVPFRRSGGNLGADFHPRILDHYFTEQGCDGGRRCWREEIDPASPADLFPGKMADLIYTLEPSS